MAKKPKTYTATMLAKIGKVSNSDVVRHLRKMGINTAEEATIGGRTYRTYGQDAYESIMAWREAKDNPPVAAPETAPAQQAPENDVYLASVFDQINQRLNILSSLEHALALTSVNVRSMFKTLNDIDAKLSSVMTDLGVKTTVLEAVVANGHDDAKKPTLAETGNAGGPRDMDRW